MSIEAEIKALLRDQRLFLVVPRVPGPRPRVIVATPSVHRKLMGPWNTEDERARWQRVSADLDRFIEGRLVNSGFLKQLDRNKHRPHLAARYEDVWEIKCIEPEPQIRIFGCFASPDCFVAMDWEYRWIMDWFNQWLNMFRRRKAIWRQLFPTREPHRGQSIHDYVKQGIVIDDYDWD